jgi:hypothetical protein
MQIEGLLDQVRAVLPRGRHEWDKVVANYNQLTQESADCERLKEKFFKLVRTVKPTGRNTKPDHVTRAQEINDTIEAKVHGAVADGHEEDSVDAVDLAERLALSDGKEEKSSQPSSSSSSDPLAPSSFSLSLFHPSSSLPSPSTSSSSSSSAPATRVKPRVFPSERSNKRLKGGSDVVEAVQSLSTTLSTAISAQLEQSRSQMQQSREAAQLEREQSREEAKLAREQASQEAKLAREQMAIQQQSLTALIAALVAKKD